MLNKINGNFFTDERGIVLFNNELDLSGIKRMYIIENKDIDIKRAWQGHQFEKRWFIAVKGKFLIKLVKIDDFQNPSDNLNLVTFELDSNNLEAILVEPGHASSIQSLELDSRLLVFSNYKIGEVEDNFKYNPTKWK